MVTLARVVGEKDSVVAPVEPAENVVLGAMGNTVTVTVAWPEVTVVVVSVANL